MLRPARRRARPAFVLAAIVAASALAPAVSAAPPSRAKDVMLESIASGADGYWQAALDIWGWAEPGYQEVKSSKRVADLLREARFDVKEGVAEIPTAFVASYGSGKPVIGILAEFDALPGLSQAAVPREQARSETTWGHGCGHHLFGVASAAAGIALARAIDRGEAAGTVRVYGTPAEEGGGAKVFMVRAGLFDDVDAVLHWHPADRNAAGDPTNQARIAGKFRFRGKSAHAAAAPQAGRSALDGLQIMAYAGELLREHTPDLTRIHYVITSGGEAPNIVPDFAEAYYYVRHPDVTVAREVWDRLLQCADAGALASGTQHAVVKPAVGTTHDTSPTSVEPLPTWPLTSSTRATASGATLSVSVSWMRAANCFSSSVYVRSFSRFRLSRVTWASVSLGSSSRVPPR